MSTINLIAFIIGILAATPLIVAASFLVARHNMREWDKAYRAHERRMGAIREGKGAK